MAASTLNLNLGIDFGTSFTKVCVRDTDRDQSWVVTFSDSKPTLTEALLPTKVGISRDGRLLLGLTQSEWDKQLKTDHTCIEFIKMQLADLDISQEQGVWWFERLPKLKELNLELNTRKVVETFIENLCVYYLSSVISKAKAWVMRNDADLVKNQKIVWSVNLGVPVQYCDSLAIKRFKKVLCLAWLLSEIHEEFLTVDDLDYYVNELSQDLTPDQMPCYVTEEIAAAIYSYTASRQAQEGIYTFFDVGSGTIDGVAFRFWREDEMPKIDFYSADVQPLGVKAFVKIVCTRLRITQKASEDALKNNETCLHTNNLTKENQLIQRQVAKVVIEGKQKNISIATVQFSQHSRSNRSHIIKPGTTLKVFLGGGGSRANFYRYIVEHTYTAFKHQNAGIPPYELTDLPTPQGDFSMTNIDPINFHRFAIAYGLSIPRDEAPEVKLPSLLTIKKRQEIKAYNYARPLEGGHAVDSEYIG
jgi:hypothetical protein